MLKSAIEGLGIALALAMLMSILTGELVSSTTFYSYFIGAFLVNYLLRSINEAKKLNDKKNKVFNRKQRILEGKQHKFKKNATNMQELRQRLQIKVKDN